MTVRYVPWPRVAEYEAAGWRMLGPCPGHHGYWSALMVEIPQETCHPLRSTAVERRP